MPRTKASNEAQYRYNAAHLKRVPLDLQLSEYEELKQAAVASGMSVNGFIKQAIRNAIAAGADPVQAVKLNDLTESGTGGGIEGGAVGGVSPISTEK